MNQRFLRDISSVLKILNPVLGVCDLHIHTFDVVILLIEFLSDFFLEFVDAGHLYLKVSSVLAPFCIAYFHIFQLKCNFEIMSALSTNWPP